MSPNNNPEQTSDLIIPVFDQAIIPADTHQVRILEEKERIKRFEGYRTTAMGYLDMAREAKSGPKGTETVLQFMIQELDYLMMVLGTEGIIHTSRPALQSALSILGTNIDRNREGKAIYSQKALTAAKISSSAASDSFSRALGLHLSTLGSGKADEKLMQLPAIGEREMRIAKDSGIPQNIRMREIPRLSDTIQQHLRTYAAGNAAITLGDINELMETLRGMQGFFIAELEECRMMTEKVDDMRESNRPEEEIMAELETDGVRERIQTFQKMILEFEVSLRIALARMQHVNHPDNHILAKEIRPDHIRKVLGQGLVSGSRGGVLNTLRRIVKPGGREIAQYDPTTAQILLKTALARRGVRR